MNSILDRQNFNSLSLRDLVQARDQFHLHLMRKKNVVGTAVGLYLIRKTDPYPDRSGATTKRDAKVLEAKPARTLENSEVRDYSWPAVLVFVSKWESPDR